MIRKAEEQDASSLAAVGIEVWLNMYLREGVSSFFVDYVLSEFTAQKFRNAIANPDLAIWVSEKPDRNRWFRDGLFNSYAAAGQSLAA
jgi:diamine N-acetyltransferase